MPEYITKEHAIDEVWDAFMSWDDPDLGRVIEENIERFPAEDVVPVVHARWELYDKDIYENDILLCSHCGNTVPSKAAKHFCTYCGARMDGENKKLY